MITTAELHRGAKREGLRFDQAEKDYIILLILASLPHLIDRNTLWAVKGGTCLRHCYYPGYRFSEDIDFTCQGVGEGTQKSLDLLTRASKLITDETGILLRCKEPLAGGDGAQVEIPVEYSRGGPRRQALPAVKIHPSFDEPLLTPPAERAVQPSWPGISPFTIWAYSMIEIVAEKMRALIQQQDRWPRPRDLYDLWYICCLKGETFDRARLRELLEQKCRVRSIVVDPSRLRSDHLPEWNRNAWTSQLIPMLRSAPDYDLVWNEWTTRSEGLL